ncbi:central glycolytic genes regulator [Geomicrobium halophilum]|uniref:Central glycolytic genes regulator n=1 Tax=Geomicrobium halophilum TaxID=549000 RepID=A0A841PZF6_9BACL|nr:sugar-binding domain-containing protein [Geomicrobium halophilum]MBB6450323.1 central glycolytic genes regulator [Geomicrobium halophilum]
MLDFIELQKKLLPDILEHLNRRYDILQFIRLSAPVGRRALAADLQISERVLRKEVELFKDQNLLKVESGGMVLTSEGLILLDQLEPMIQSISGRSQLEKDLEDALGVSKVIVTTGDSDVKNWVKKEMSRACVREMIQTLAPGDVVAVAGGTTLATLASSVYPDPALREITFVPARGGLGENVDLQSNTISAELARSANAQYRLLHVPDQLSDLAYDSLIHEPGIKELLNLIRSPRMVIHSVGDAQTMAIRRSSDPHKLQLLKDREAIAEAFGYYFDNQGNVVHKEKTIGLQLDDLGSEQTVVTIAGGVSKAEAIVAYMTYKPSGLLITDEGAAKAVMTLLH